MADKKSALVAAMEERDELITSIDRRASGLGLEIPPIAPMAIRTGIQLDERSDAVAVISLQGLRRIDAVLQEVEQRRDQVEELHEEPRDDG